MVFLIRTNQHESRKNGTEQKEKLFDIAKNEWTNFVAKTWICCEFAKYPAIDLIKSVRWI